MAVSMAMSRYDFFLFFSMPVGRGGRSGRGRGAPTPRFNTGRGSALRWQKPVELFEMAAGR